VSVKNSQKWGKKPVNSFDITYTKSTRAKIKTAIISLYY